eukprot:scaffold210452_cov32-Tisochrysis_lutea.AAC.2
MPVNGLIINSATPVTTVAGGIVSAAVPTTTSIGVSGATEAALNGQTTANVLKATALKASVNCGTEAHRGAMARPTKGVAAAPAVVAASVTGRLVPKKTEKAQPTSAPL